MLNKHQSIEAGTILMKALTEYYAEERGGVEVSGKRDWNNPASHG